MVQCRGGPVGGCNGHGEDRGEESNRYELVESEGDGVCMLGGCMCAKQVKRPEDCAYKGEGFPGS